MTDERSNAELAVENAAMKKVIEKLVGEAAEKDARIIFLTNRLAIQQERLAPGIPMGRAYDRPGTFGKRTGW